MIGAICLAAALLLGACQPAEIPTEPVLSDAWVRSLPPGMKMTAAFGTLENVTAEKIDIESFTSPTFSSVSLHLSETVDGVSRMREIESYSLSAGESLEMAPGGYHLMLMGPMQSMAPGAVVTLELNTSNGRSFSFEVPVEKR